MPLTRPTNRSRTLVAAIFATLATGAGDQPQTHTPKVSVGVIWTGTATIDQTFSPGIDFKAADWTGSHRDHRDVRILARERRSEDVNDATGRLVGRLTWLEDAGTTWTGRVWTTETHLGNIRFIADQSGSGNAMVFGVVYRSLVTPNPAGATLPDGTYCLQVTPIPSIRYRQILREPGRPDEVNDYDALSGFTGGESSLGRKFATAKRPLTVESVAAAIQGADWPGEIYEGRSRVLDNGVMTGTFKRIDGGSVNEATWSVKRKLQINGAITATDGAWRPKFLGKTSFTASMPESLGATGKFRFTLYDVSREPGIALNDGTGTGLDLRFSDEQATTMMTPVHTSDGWTVETSATAASAAVSVTALDYGAWGKLKAEVNVDGEWYECLSPDGKASVTLPLDTNGNHIWDTWERNSGVWGKPAAEDGDETPEGAGKGDGFSNFEEYRGFMVAGTWVSTDPAAKELFVFDEAGWGTGLFWKTGILIYQIDQDDMNSKRVVNFNRGTSTAGAQKALHVRDDRLEPGILGLTYIGSPNQTHEVLLDLRQLAAESADAIGSVIAHELGHGVGVEHHGDYTERTCHGGPKGLYAPQGGAWSGDRGCVMSYSAALYYAGWDGKCYDYTWPSEFGTAFCSARTGTGLNAGPQHMEDGHPLPVSGDATHGNCLHQLRLK